MAMSEEKKKILDELKNKDIIYNEKLLWEISYSSLYV